MTRPNAAHQLTGLLTTGALTKVPLMTSPAPTGAIPSEEATR